MARARASKKSTTAAAAAARREPEEQPLQSTPADEKPAEEPAAKPAEDVEPASTVPGPPSPVLGQTSRPGSSLSYEVLARGRHDKLHLSPEDGQKVADWFVDHPIFYDKARRDYKDTALKSRKLEEIAASLSVPCSAHAFKTWLDSMPTSAGKLLKQGPSGTVVQRTWALAR